MSKPISVGDIVEHPERFYLVPVFDHGMLQGYMIKPELASLAFGQKQEIEEAVQVTVGKYRDTFKKLRDDDESIRSRAEAMAIDLTNMTLPQRVDYLVTELPNYTLQRSREAEIAGRVDEVERMRAAMTFGHTTPTTYREKRLAELTKNQPEAGDAAA